MPNLTINGVTVPVFHDSVEETTDDIGESSDTRGLMGNALRTRIGRLRSWRFSTPLLTPATAESYRKLLEGYGHSWTFVATAQGTSYPTQLSACGLAPTSAGTWTVSATGGRWFGDVTVGSGSSFGVDMKRRSGVMRKGGWDPAIDGFTVGVWRREGGVGGTWVHHIMKGKLAVGRGAVIGQKTYQNGVTTALGISRAMSVQLTAPYVAIWGYVVATNVAAAVEYSDLFFLPYEVPDTWVAQLYAAALTREFSRLPLVNANGDFTTDTQDIEVMCRVRTVAHGTGNVDGTGVITNAKVLEVEMQENL